MEAFATRMGLPSPDLTLRQRGLQVSRLTATSGAASGVVVGCVLGMATLLFMDTTHAEREKKQVRMLLHATLHLCLLCLPCAAGCLMPHVKNHNFESGRRFLLFSR